MVAAFAVLLQYPRSYRDSGFRFYGTTAAILWTKVAALTW